MGNESGGYENVKLDDDKGCSIYESIKTTEWNCMLNGCEFYGM